MRLRRYLSAAIASALVLTGCGALTGKPFPQAVSDVTLTTQVKSRLAAIQGVGSITSISVNTSDDWVTLRGVVADEATRQRVLRAAGAVAGDNRVIDNLSVRQPPSASAANR
jgi:osmotically-inducible protein OsmY